MARVRLAVGAEVATVAAHRFLASAALKPIEADKDMITVHVARRVAHHQTVAVEPKVLEELLRGP